MVTLGAYTVNIRNIADPEKGAILKLLLQKYSSGATSKKIWEFPVIRAVIEHHWTTWARKFLLFSSMLYLSWVISFTVYLVLYIVPLPQTSLEIGCLAMYCVGVWNWKRLFTQSGTVSHF